MKYLYSKQSWQGKFERKKRKKLPLTNKTMKRYFPPGHYLHEEGEKVPPITHQIPPYYTPTPPPDPIVVSLTHSIAPQLYTKLERTKRNLLFKWANNPTIPPIKEENHPNLNKLGKLFLKYQSSKLEIGYQIPMQKFFPKTADSILEIGTYRGAGIRAFKEYYPKAKCFGLNYIFGGPDIPPQSYFNEWGITCFEGYQEDIKFLTTIKEQFKIITDDGSHHSDSQIITFKHMFFNNLKSGGIYVVEDLHCCKESYWWREIKKFKDTFLGIVKNVLKGGSFESQLISKEESELLKKSIKKIELPNDSIVFLFKK